MSATCFGIHAYATSVIVVVMTSSAVVNPASTLRTPSSRNVRMPSSRARLAKLDGRRPVNDHVPHFIVDHEQLENAHPAFEALCRGSFASGRPSDRAFDDLSSHRGEGLWLRRR